MLSFFATTYKETYKPHALLRFITIDMPKDEINILGSKAVIFQNSFGVWQFRMWLADEDKYFRQSLRTKNREDAIHKAEDMYAELRYLKKQGKKIYSISIKQAVEMYLTYKKNFVGISGANSIVIGRWNTIRTHLNHFLDYVKKDAKVKDLGLNTLLSYEREGDEISYELFRKKNNAADDTIRNEVASINACIKYLYEHKEGLADIQAFKVPPLTKRKYDVDGEQIRRQTFTSEEWKSFYTAMRTYSAKSHNKDEAEYFDKQLVRHFLLVMANSGMRNGELRQLKWKNVSVEKHIGISQESYSLVRIKVEPQTTKVRIGRTFYANCGKYIERWTKIVKESGREINAEDFVFSKDGKEFSNSSLNKHFTKIMAMTSIPKDRVDDLVIYSLRHMFITNMSLAEATYDSIAQHCGTSIQQIERVYKHSTDEERRSFAIKRYMRVGDNIVAMSDTFGD